MPRCDEGSLKRSRAKRRARVGLVREGGASRDALCVRPLRRDARSDAPNDAHEARRVSHAETRGVQCRSLYALRPQGRQVVPDRTGDLVRVVVTETGICLRRRCMQIPVVGATTLLAGISAYMIFVNSHGFCIQARASDDAAGRSVDTCSRLYAKPKSASQATNKITDRMRRASDCKIWIALHAIELRREVFSRRVAHQPRHKNGSRDAMRRLSNTVRVSGFRREPTTRTPSKSRLRFSLSAKRPTAI